jgi:glucosamine-6-phosphate deaminase
MAQIARCKTREDVGGMAALALSSFLLDRPNSLVGLPTGRTVMPMYRRLAQMHKAGRFDPKDALFFALDEVVCRSGRRPFRDFLTESFLGPCRIKPARFNTLNPSLADENDECAQYEQEIRRRGGSDLILLGIGRNGHIAFNEPGSAFDSMTRRVSLAGDTKDHISCAFGLEPGDIAGAVTIGIATILGSTKVLLVASGREKAAALARALSGPPDPSCPASALGLHNDVTVIADTDALALVDGKG